MKICHVISADLWAGAAVQVFHTVVELHERKGIDVRVVVLNEGVLADRLTAQNVPWRLLDEKRQSPLALARHLARLITEWTPDVLHVHAYKEHILATAARVAAGRMDIPVVRTFHGRTRIPRTLPGVRRLKSKTVEYLERLLLRRATLIAVSRDLKLYLQDAYPDSRVCLVANGIPLPTGTSSRSRIRNRRGVPDNVFWVGSVARLEPVKNLPCLVRAAALASEALPDLRVSIFGDGSQYGALRKLISDLHAESVVFLEGFDDEIVATTGALDCFVLSSWHEGLPMSLLEAMALGVPPVCSRVGGMAELITPGVTGLLFESDHSTDLATCLKQIHDDRHVAVRMGEAARALVRQCYSIERANQGLLKLYDSVAPAANTGRQG